MTSSSENRVRVQISVLGQFLPSFWYHLCSSWIVERRWRCRQPSGTLSDFHWGKERLSVSPFLYSYVAKYVCPSFANIVI